MYSQLFQGASGAVPGHYRNIVCAAVVACVGKACESRKLVFHPEFPGFLIHHRHKGFLAACNSFCQRHRCVVCRMCGHAFSNSSTVNTSPARAIPANLQSSMNIRLPSPSYHMRLFTASIASMIAASTLSRYACYRMLFMTVLIQEDRSGTAVHQQSGF